MGDLVPMLLDTDIGSDIDDAVCLAYLLAEPRCELMGITTVTGEPCERAKLCDALCLAAGRTDVTVHAGTDAPLLRSQSQPKAPQAEVLGNWPHATDFAPYEAVDFLRCTIRNRPGEITLLTIGPLTNVGLLFAVDPEVPRLLKRLVMMGGRYFAGPHAQEWNTMLDPIAAALVFNAPVPELVACGLDVTLKCRMPAHECRRLFKGGPLDIVGAMAEVWFRDQEVITFHDPLAAACIFEPDLCTYRRGRVTMTLGETEEQDSSVTIFREDPIGPHSVADDVNPERFFDRYFRTVARFSAG